jgi:hypothetical protein
MGRIKVQVVQPKRQKVNKMKKNFQFGDQRPLVAQTQETKGKTCKKNMN